MKLINATFTLMLIIVTPSFAQATTIRGDFTGTVSRGNGILDGIDFSSFAGQSITGSFTYDSSAWVLGSSDGVTYSHWSTSTSATPTVFFTETIGTNTYNLSADSGAGLNLYDSLVDDPARPDLKINGFGIGASSNFGGRSNSMSLGLGNLLGQHFLTDIGNPGSVSFSGASSLNENVANFTSASYVFTVSSLSVGPTVSVSEPKTYALLLTGIGLLGWMTKRRAELRRSSEVVSTSGSTGASRCAIQPRRDV